MNYHRNEVEKSMCLNDPQTVLAGDSILLIGLPMPDMSDGRSETKYSSNQTSWKT